VVSRLGVHSDSGPDGRLLYMDFGVHYTHLECLVLCIVTMVSRLDV